MKRLVLMVLLLIMLVGCGDDTLTGGDYDYTITDASQGYSNNDPITGKITNTGSETLRDVIVVVKVFFLDELQTVNFGVPDKDIIAPGDTAEFTVSITIGTTSLYDARVTYTVKLIYD